MMSVIKRLSTSLFAQIDHVVGELENHDALIKATINEQQKKLAYAKIQMARLHSNEQELKTKIAELSLLEKRWTQRAIENAASDESKALACLQRRSNIQVEISKLQLMQKDYQNSAKNMHNDINHCELALRSMIQKQELMRARQTSADVLQAINQMGGSNMSTLQNSFDRWEAKILHNEMMTNIHSEVDDLDSEFIQIEATEALQEQLKALIQSQKNDNPTSLPSNTESI